NLTSHVDKTVNLHSLGKETRHLENPRQEVDRCMRILILTLLCSAAFPLAVAQTDWPIYGHDPGGLQYSPLKLIDTKNVSKLQVAWTYDTRPPAPPPATDALPPAEAAPAARPVAPRARASQATPLMVGGMLYLSS